VRKNIPNQYEDCGNYFALDKIYSIDNGDKEVCDNCLGNYYQCGDCNDYFSDTTTVGDIEICDDCLRIKYIKCDDCEEYIRKDYVISVEEDKGVCKDCFQEKYSLVVTGKENE